MPRVPSMSVTLTGAVQTTASHLLRLTLAALTGVLIARTLQPEGRGVYAMIATTGGIAIVIGSLSIGRSQIALWPDGARHRTLTGNGLLLGLILGVASALVTLAIVITFVPLTAPHLLVVALLAVPFGVAAVNLNGIALLRSRIGLANRTVVASALVLNVPVLVLAAIGHLTVTAVVVCWTAAIAVPFWLLLGPLGLRAMRVEAALARRQLALSCRYHVGVVASHLLLSADIFLLSALVSPAEVGLYTVGTAFLTFARVPADAVTQIALPRQAIPDERAARDVTARVLRVNLLISSTLVGTLAIVSPVLIPLLYGAAFARSVAPLLLLAPGVIALSLIRPVEQYLVRLGRPMTMTAIAFGALATNLALNAVLIPRWGARGAALSATVSYTAMLAAEVVWFARAASAGVRELLPQVSDLRSMVSMLSGAGRTPPTAATRQEEDRVVP
ncbi:lipopolysaccharide biosynthesis protein [Streptosporangium subroseum]|uniref:lipopolysaccharide biosynthesis protein n=1 Tax=Streptosporangium subroseum TaxID=106412 RepID=UPI0030926098|nr:polysaccharide biosynthesis C-terminal domain-containing protein [Streptosporangium subroseum]